MWFAKTDICLRQTKAFKNRYLNKGIITVIRQIGQNVLIK